jgi:hypothetical protein
MGVLKAIGWSHWFQHLVVTFIMYLKSFWKFYNFSKIETPRKIHFNFRSKKQILIFSWTEYAQIQNKVKTSEFIANIVYIYILVDLVLIKSTLTTESIIILIN